MAHATNVSVVLAEPEITLIGAFRHWVDFQILLFFMEHQSTPNVKRSELRKTISTVSILHIIVKRVTYLLYIYFTLIKTDYDGRSKRKEKKKKDARGVARGFILMRTLRCCFIPRFCLLYKF